ncbi:uncharacterized protein LOC110880597 [Helianthus annuus]|uniref:Uncharacterized protein n=1 Tax=Helianthus annuus TaxID=4232 RepID=A0A251VTR6_HELAN|nr:uncharacterized protein LOC110880597 [Helianthus annuus]
MMTAAMWSICFQNHLLLYRSRFHDNLCGLSNQDMSIAPLKEIATSIHRFNRRSIETSASLAIVAFTSLKAKNQGLQLQLKKKALQLERSVNWNSTTQIHRRKGLAKAASRTKTQLTEVRPFVHQYKNVEWDGGQELIPFVQMMMTAC